MSINKIITSLWVTIVFVNMFWLRGILLQTVHYNNENDRLEFSCAPLCALRHFSYTYILDIGITFDKSELKNYI